MPQMRTLITTVAGAQFKAQHQATEEFWRRLAASNGGRQGDPHDYAEIVDIYYDEGRGWVIEYEVPAELLEQRAVSVIMEEPEPNCQNVLKTAKLAEPTPPQAEPVFESVDGEQRPIPVKDVMITGWNPRKAFDAEALQALAEDIRQNGLINAVTVRPKGKRYELVAGERRLRAFRLLGRATIPAKVRELTDEQVLDIMLAENLQRVDLNPIEEAHHLKRVLEVGKLTQTELGKRIGKSQEWVSQRLRLAEAPGVLQDMIISRLISPWSAIEVMAWQNTEHFESIMCDVKAWKSAGEELPRETLRVIIRKITEPVITLQPKDPTCKDCGNSTWSDGKLICVHHGQVNPDGRYCEKFVAPSLGDDDGPVSEGERAEPTDLPFVNPEDCKDCDIYDREKNECPEGCTCAEECEDCFCEVTEDEEGGCEMFGVPGAADDDVCAVDCPEYDACKSEAAANEDDDDQDLPQETEPVPEQVEIPLRKDEKPADFTRNTGVPKITGNHDGEMFHGQMCGNSNGNITVRMGPKGAHTELEAMIAEAIGCAEGDVVPIAVDIARGAITIRRRGKF